MDGKFGRRSRIVVQTQVVDPLPCFRVQHLGKSATDTVIFCLACNVAA
jgi:hypothetical protein